MSECSIIPFAVATRRAIYARRNKAYHITDEDTFSFYHTDSSSVIQNQLKEYYHEEDRKEDDEERWT